MRSIKNHYRKTRTDLRLRSLGEAKKMLRLTRSSKAILPVRDLNRAAIKAYNCAQDIGFTEIEIYHVGSSENDALTLQSQIEELGLKCAYVYEVTEYRNTEELLIRHIEAEEAKLTHHEHLTVVMPNLVTANPLKQYLHNETSRALLSRMARYRYVYIFQVPYLFD